MVLAWIGTDEKAQDLRAVLDREFRFLNRQGHRLSLEEENLGTTTYLHVRVDRVGSDGSEPERSGYTGRLARALTHFIIHELEPALLGRLVRRHYSYFDHQERSTIIVQAVEYLSRAAHEPRGTSILQSIRDYLAGEEVLNLDGFVTFRLRDYVQELEEAVDQAVDDFLVEKEYREFIRLLRYFVEAQQPHLAMAHVLVHGAHNFQIYDEVFRPVENQELQEFVVEMVDTEICYEDLLVSALITVAPASITLHGPVGRLGAESLRTVESVFGERLSVCRGCAFCESQMRIGPEA